MDVWKLRIAFAAAILRSYLIIVFFAVIRLMRLKRFNEFVNMFPDGLVGKNKLRVAIVNHSSLRLARKEQRAGANERFKIAQAIKILGEMLLQLRQELPFPTRPFQIRLDQRIPAQNVYFSVMVIVASQSGGGGFA